MKKVIRYKRDRQVRKWVKSEVLEVDDQEAEFLLKCNTKDDRYEIYNETEPTPTPRQEHKKIRCKRYRRQRDGTYSYWDTREFNEPVVIENEKNPNPDPKLIRHPYRWYELHGFRVFFKNLRKKITQRYAKPQAIRRAIYDLSIFIISTIIATAILKFWLKWI